MSADKVKDAHDALVSEILDEMSGGPPGRPTRWGEMLDALIAAVRDDEKARCIAAVMNKRPDVAYDRDDDHINQGLSLAVEAIRHA